MMAHAWYSTYDSLISKVCPDYELGLDAIVKGILGDVNRILELGCGTGNLTSLLAKTFPQAQIVGIDKEELMLDIARTKLRRYKNVELINRKIPQVDAKGFDAVVSSLVFHLLPEEDRLQMLQTVYKSGAKYFVIFDRMKGESEEQENTFLHYFAQQLQGKELPDDAQHQLVQESKKNNPMKLSEHRAICEENELKFEILHQNPNHGFMVYRGIR